MSKSKAYFGGEIVFHLLGNLQKKKKKTKRGICLGSRPGRNVLPLLNADDLEFGPWLTNSHGTFLLIKLICISLYMI